MVVPHSGHPIFIFGTLCRHQITSVARKFSGDFFQQRCFRPAIPPSCALGLDLLADINLDNNQSFIHFHTRDLSSKATNTRRHVTNIPATPFFQWVILLRQSLLTPWFLHLRFTSMTFSLFFFSLTSCETLYFYRFRDLPTTIVTALCFSRAPTPATSFSHLQQLCFALVLLLSC